LEVVDKVENNPMILGYSDWIIIKSLRRMRLEAIMVVTSLWYSGKFACKIC
jgi:hypothetical protein